MPDVDELLLIPGRRVSRAPTATCATSASQTTRYHGLTRVSMGNAATTNVNLHEREERIAERIAAACCAARCNKCFAINACGHAPPLQSCSILRLHNPDTLLEFTFPGWTAAATNQAARSRADVHAHPDALATKRMEITLLRTVGALKRGSAGKAAPARRRPVLAQALVLAARAAALATAARVTVAAPRATANIEQGCGFV